MTDPQLFTTQQASDPATPAQVLADIAALRPDLRPAVAANPSAYPGLLEWLGGLGEPAVDAALAARPSAADAAATQVLPTPSGAPSAAPGSAAPPWTGQAPAWQGQAPAGAPAPGGTPALGGPYGAPGGQGQPPFGQGQPPFGQGQAPYAQQPGFGQPPYGGPAPKKGNRALVIVLIVLGVLLALGIGAFFLVKSLVDRVAEDFPDISELESESGQTYGDNAALDALWDACEAEDWAACDDLFFQSQSGSDYEDFGDTCGNRTDGGSLCVETFGDAAGTGTEGTTEPSAYGDDPELDALYDACGAGDGDACDRLYFEAPMGSEYETFGDTCGGTAEAGTVCGASADTASDASAYGDDPALDALYDACGAGDGVACDDLYFQAPAGSEYEAFADTCGGRAEAGTICSEQ